MPPAMPIMPAIMEDTKALRVNTINQGSEISIAPLNTGKRQSQAVTVCPTPDDPQGGAGLGFD